MDRYPDPDVTELAGVLDRRLEALLIDGLLVVGVIGLLGYVGGALLIEGSFGGFGGFLVAVQFISPVVLLGYQTVFEGYYGQTLGKRYRDIVVVTEDGDDCTWVAAVVRNLLRIVDALPAFYLVGVLVAYVSDEHQRLGDLAAGTRVVNVDE
ncbi:hypothetical protein GCM10027435_11780 [Haloparvum alkalitolerans]|uniref:RDD family protein n=1 Tax=Haloparvum alkalitolerans TaxID=1042953 RepID=UPI003CF26505